MLFESRIAGGMCSCMTMLLLLVGLKHIGASGRLEMVRRTTPAWIHAAATVA